jgi:hypothetical protein
MHLYRIPSTGRVKRQCIPTTFLRDPDLQGMVQASTYVRTYYVSIPFARGKRLAVNPNFQLPALLEEKLHLLHMDLKCSLDIHHD